MQGFEQEVREYAGQHDAHGETEVGVGVAGELVEEEQAEGDQPSF